MSESVTTFRCGQMLFIADPGLHAACVAAREMASRCKRSSIEAADLLLGVYYGARTETSELLHMAVKDQALDAACFTHWRSDLCGRGGAGGFGASGLAILAQAAELGMHYRAPLEPEVALLTSADVAVALVNDDTVRAALRASGVSEVYLRHVEAALRLQERQPISLDVPSMTPPTSLLVH